MHRCLAHAFLACTLAAAGLPFSARAQDSERRLAQYHCVLRLPGPDFTWLADGDIPGATLACRDPKDRFVILVVAEAPPGYHIDARQGAAFEKGMDKFPTIERLGARLTEFLGVPCYEIRGRLKTDQSLTLTRFFAANGFLYNLQAMLPAGPEGETSSFDDLFAAFRFIDPTAAPGTGRTTASAASAEAPVAAVAPASRPTATGDANQDIQTPSEALPPKSSQNPPSPASSGDDAPKATVPWSSPGFSFATIATGGLLGLIFSVILLRMFHGGRPPR